MNQTEKNITGEKITSTLDGPSRNNDSRRLRDGVRVKNTETRNLESLVEAANGLNAL